MPRLVLAALAGGIILAYCAVIFVIVRRESWATRSALGLIVLAALGLRLVYSDGYPSGFCEDEVRFLCDAVRTYRAGNLSQILFTFTSGVPTALQAIFGAQFVALLGPRAAIRWYSLLGSVLSCVVAFGILRQMGCRATGALTVGALVAVLPWSLLYGRTSEGGEIVLHYYLVLWALAVLCWGERIAGAAAVGALALTLLFYDYYCGRGALYVVLAAAALAPTWPRRGIALLIGALALGAYAPTFFVIPTHFHPGVYFRAVGIPLIDWHTGTIALFDPVRRALLWQNMVGLEALVRPTAAAFWMSIPGAAVHPVALLVLCAWGLCYGTWRARLLMVAAIVAGFAPMLMADEKISTHRMLLGCSAVVLPIGMLVDHMHSGVRQAVAVALGVTAVAWWSLHFYFGGTLWDPPNNWIYHQITYSGAYAEPGKDALCPQLPWSSEGS